MSFSAVRAKLSSSVVRHPVLHGSYCINKKQRLKRCGVCRDVCPQGVYLVSSGSAPRWDECINCGLCSAQCPARCITPSNADVENYIFALMDAQLPVVSCSRSSAHSNIQVFCLGAIPWEYLAYISLTHNVVLCRDDCGACELKRGGELFAKSLFKLWQFHGSESFEQHVFVTSQAHFEADELRVEGPAFLGAEKRGQSVVARAVLDLRTRDYGGLLFRNMLANLIDFANAHLHGEPLSCTVDVPRPNEKCYACGICADLCPHEALSVELDADSLGIVSVNAWRCVGCGTCAVVCRRGAMDEPRPTELSSLRLQQHRLPTIARCSVCGSPVAPEDGAICKLCLREREHPLTTRKRRW